jgi:hypothetical protein
MVAPNDDPRELLLDELCVRLGFCLPPAVQQELLQRPLHDADSFVDEVARAEGFDATAMDRDLLRRMRGLAAAAFARRPGSVHEHEVIEQIEDEAGGRSLPWVCDLLRRLGREQPLVVVRGMVQGGWLELADADGPLPAWRVAELWRSGQEPDAVRVLATDAGSDGALGCARP